MASLFALAAFVGTALHGVNAKATLLYDDLYAIQGGEMFAVNNDTGAYQQIGANNEWTGATSFATNGSGSGWVIQGDKLWEVNLGSPQYTEVGTGTWPGPTEMTFGREYNSSTGSFEDRLWAVQEDSLWKVQISTGAISLLGTAGDWVNSTSMAFMDYDATNDDIFIVQNSALWRVNATTGAYTQLGSSGAWAGETSMVAYGTTLRIVQGGRLWSVDPSNGAYTQLGTASWPTTTSMTSLSGSLYIIDSARLHKVDPTNGAWSYIGGAGEWAGPTLLGRVRVDSPH